MTPEIGAVLPSAGAEVSVDDSARVADAAEELGFDSVWASEHMLVGDDAAGSYGQVLDNVSLLAWLGGRHERLGLGTSILLLPLHHPAAVAKRAATVQQVTGGRFRLGVGAGWHEPEFRFLGYPFADRGRRFDEGLRLMRALWAGDREFEGETWSFRDANFGPLPDPQPEVWIGGNSAAAVRRARDYGDVHHPFGIGAGGIRALRSGWPSGRIVPRYTIAFGGEGDGAGTIAGDPGTVAERCREVLQAGADGLVLRFGGAAADSIAAMRRFAEEVRPKL